MAVEGRAGHGGTGWQTVQPVRLHRAPRDFQGLLRAPRSPRDFPNPPGPSGSSGHPQALPAPQAPPASPPSAGTGTGTALSGPAAPHGDTWRRHQGLEARPHGMDSGTPRWARAHRDGDSSGTPRRSRAHRTGTQVSVLAAAPRLTLHLGRPDWLQPLCSTAPVSLFSGTGALGWDCTSGGDTSSCSLA